MNPQLHLVESFDDAQRFLDWLAQPRPWLAVDTETTGLQWWTPGFVRTVQFGDKEHGWAIPMEWWPRLVKDALLSLTNSRIVMHNAKFDLHALESAGIVLPDNVIDDTMLMSWLVNPIGSHALKTLATKYADRSAAVGQRILNDAKRVNKWNWANIPLDFIGYWAYGALDTVLTAMLVEDLSTEIDALGLRPSYEMELAASHILRKAERRGARLDMEYTANLQTQWARRMATLEMELTNFGVDNPNASAQVAHALQRQGWEPSEFTVTGRPKLDDKVLKGMDSEIADRIVEYKRLRKWSSTYLDTFLNDHDNGVLHASINTLRARTGRMSITNPPLQTLPRGPEIRDCIIPSDGRLLLAADYSQVELRMLAHFAQERPMIEAFERGEDLHADTARRVYGENFTKAQRSISKNGNFATIYGAGPRKFAETCGISEDEARAFLDRYKATYPGVTAFMRNIEEVAKGRLAAEGLPYVRTTGGRRLPSEHDKLYTLVNYLCQGTAAEVLKNAIIRIDDAGLSDYIVLPVHDELIFDIPKEDVDEVAPLLKDLMEDSSFTVPLTVEVSQPLERWGDAYREKVA